MKPLFDLLLPLLSNEELELFGDVPAEALLASSNLPAVAEIVQPTLRILAPRIVLAGLERVPQVLRLQQYAELRTIAIDDLALDHDFPVLPSLACLRGIAERKEQLTRTSFVFLQPNLVLADGALRNVVCRLADGAQAITATYLRASRGRMTARLRGAAQSGGEFNTRVLARRAIECLDIDNLASIVNSELKLVGPAGRFFWQHDATTLLARDFSPSLVALRPTHTPDPECGFRDTAFVASMAPDAQQSHVTDSDEFLGIELTDGAEEGIWMGHRAAAAAARELWWSTAAQRAIGLHQPVVFRAGNVPAELSRTAAKAQQYVSAVAARLGPAASPLRHPRWRISHYLWAVRKFELGHGPLPDAPFPDLFGDAQRSAEAVGREFTFFGLDALVRVVRWMGRLLLGQAPRVSFLHPEWRTYRHMQPVLRLVAGRSSAILYIGDDVSALRRVFGAPAFTSSDVLDAAFDRLCPDGRMLDLAVVEPGAKRSTSWSDMIRKVLPVIRPGGRIVLFHRNSARVPIIELGNALVRIAADLNKSDRGRVSISVEKNSHYVTWLHEGYAIALRHARKRRPLSLLYGAAMLGVCLVLTLVHNLFGLLPAVDEDPVEMWASVTIVIDV